MPGLGNVHVANVVAPAERDRWVREIYAARERWTPCFEGVQFTLGRAYYTHLEEEHEAEYFAHAVESDIGVERVVPGLQDRVREILASLLGTPVIPRPGWCGPGVHIFPAGEWLSNHGGDVHFDTEGLSEEDLHERRPALSAIIMLQPPVSGGGLRVWDALWDGRDDPPAIARATRAPSAVVQYAAGDLLVIDSYRLHQIQPFTGPRDRLSVTAHLILSPDGWQSWF